MAVTVILREKQKKKKIDRVKNKLETMRYVSLPILVSSRPNERRTHYTRGMYSGFSIGSGCSSIKIESIMMFFCFGELFFCFWPVNFAGFLWEFHCEINRPKTNLLFI